MDNKDWYSVKEVAELFNVNEQTIRRYISSGKLEAENRGGSVGYRVSKDKLEGFIKQSKYKLITETRFEEPQGLLGRLFKLTGHPFVTAGNVTTKTIYSPENNTRISKEEKEIITDINDNKMNLLYQYVLDCKKNFLIHEISDLEYELNAIENEIKYCKLKSNEEKMSVIKSYMNDNEIEEMIKNLN